MRAFNGRIAVGIFLACLFAALSPMNGFGKVFLQTDIATGIVIDIKKNVILLDSGVKYHPAKDEVELDIVAGDQITLRFYSDVENKNMYTAVAAGLNSLEKSSPPPEVKRGFK